MKSLLEFIVKNKVNQIKLKDFINKDNTNWIQFILLVYQNKNKDHCIKIINGLREEVFYKEFCYVLWSYPFEDYIDEPEPLEQDGEHIYKLINSLPEDLIDAIKEEYKKYNRK